MSREPSLTDADWALRTRVYRDFVETTRGPTTEELTRATVRSVEEVEASLRRLEDGHHLALFPDRHEVWMAHPFSSVPTPFPVDTPRGRYWGNCAWDALGVLGILESDGSVEAACGETGEALSFAVRDGRFHGDEAVFHTVVPIRDAWVDIGFT